MKDTLFVIFMCWIFLLTLVLRLIFEGVKLMRHSYVYIPLIVGVLLLLFFPTSPYNVNKKEPIKPVIKQQEECRTWNEPVNINVHLGYIVRCRLSNKETYRLYFGKEILLEEVYVNGVFLSRSINNNLLLRLKKPKQKKKTPTLTTKVTTNVRKDI